MKTAGRDRPLPAYRWTRREAAGQWGRSCHRPLVELCCRNPRQSETSRLRRHLFGRWCGRPVSPNGQASMDVGWVGCHLGAGRSGYNPRYFPGWFSQLTSATQASVTIFQVSMRMSRQLCHVTAGGLVGREAEGLGWGTGVQNTSRGLMIDIKSSFAGHSSLPGFRVGSCNQPRHSGGVIFWYLWLSFALSAMGSACDFTPLICPDL